MLSQCYKTKRELLQCGILQLLWTSDENNKVNDKLNNVIHRSLQMLHMIPVFHSETRQIMHNYLTDTATTHIKCPEVSHWALKHK